MLQESLNWFSFYVNNWNPIINQTNSKKDEIDLTGYIPKMNTGNKTPRNIKSEK